MGEGRSSINAAHCHVSTRYLLSSPGSGFQRVLVLAVENEFTSLVVHRRPRC
jgi:hypothetical protein